MKTYLVVIKWNDPYPKEFKYTEAGSSLAVAIAKAARRFRNENKGRRIKQININVTQL